jgi:hypothetical protein
MCKVYLLEEREEAISAHPGSILGALQHRARRLAALALHAIKGSTAL